MVTEVFIKSILQNVNNRFFCTEIKRLMLELSWIISVAGNYLKSGTSVNTSL